MKLGGTTLEWDRPISAGPETGSRDADWRASSRTEDSGRSLAEDKRTEGGIADAMANERLSARMESRTACGEEVAEQDVRI